MKRSKFTVTVLLAMVAAGVFVAATSAVANPGGGTVYGEATMQPTVSIVLSGAGSEPNMPLVYSGRAGNWAPASNWNRVTVNNNGDVAVPLRLGYGSDPTDGENTWQFGNFPDESHCVWEFNGMWPLNGWAVVPDSMSGPTPLGMEPLPVGQSADLDSFFTFPMTYDGTMHTMSALIIAGTES